MHVPATHVSVCVQALPSLQAVPSGDGDPPVHVPVEASQLPPWWQLWEPQTTGFEPTQYPDWQVSVWVHGLWSLHAVPFDLPVHWPHGITIWAVVQPGTMQWPGCPLTNVSPPQLAWKLQFPGYRWNVT